MDHKLCIQSNFYVWIFFIKHPPFQNWRTWSFVNQVFLFATIYRMSAHSTHSIWHISIRAINANYAFNNVNLKSTKTRRIHQNWKNCKHTLCARVKFFFFFLSLFRSFAAQCQIIHNRQHTALHICNALDKYILVSFGEKSCWYGRIGPCNQDQAWKNKTATDPIN